jgi:hypothetical protein
MCYVFWTQGLFITRKGAERMELQLEELKARIKVHFVDGVPHCTTLQAKEVPLQLGNWRRKVDLLVSTLGGIDCILGMEFITQNVATLLWAKCGGEAQHSQSWELGVLWDSRMFRARQQGPKHLALRRSWCHWKGLET